MPQPIKIIPLSDFNAPFEAVSGDHRHTVFRATNKHDGKTYYIKTVAGTEEFTELAISLESLAQNIFRLYSPSQPETYKVYDEATGTHYVASQAVSTQHWLMFYISIRASNYTRGLGKIVTTSLLVQEVDLRQENHIALAENGVFVKIDGGCAFWEVLFNSPPHVSCAITSTTIDRLPYLDTPQCQVHSWLDQLISTRGGVVENPSLDPGQREAMAALPELRLEINHNLLAIIITPPSFFERLVNAFIPQEHQERTYKFMLERQSILRQAALANEAFKQYMKAEGQSGGLFGMALVLVDLKTFAIQGQAPLFSEAEFENLKMQVLMNFLQLHNTQPIVPPIPRQAEEVPSTEAKEDEVYYDALTAEDDEVSAEGPRYQDALTAEDYTRLYNVNITPIEPAAFIVAKISPPSDLVVTTYMPREYPNCSVGRPWCQKTPYGEYCEVLVSGLSSPTAQLCTKPYFENGYTIQFCIVPLDPHTALYTRHTVESIPMLAAEEEHQALSEYSFASAGATFGLSFMHAATVAAVGEGTKALGGGDTTKVATAERIAGHTFSLMCHLATNGINLYRLWPWAIKSLTAEVMRFACRKAGLHQGATEILCTGASHAVEASISGPLPVLYNAAIAFTGSALGRGAVKKMLSFFWSSTASETSDTTNVEHGAPPVVSYS